MTLVKSLLAAAAVALGLPALSSPALAQDGLMIVEPYARASTMMSASGAAFFVIENHTMQDDRLIGVKTDVAERAELHTHKADANGVMQMVAVPEGFAVPAHGSHALARGGDHVMLIGLRKSLAQGDKITLTLVFEKAGEVPVEVPVDMERPAGQGMPMQGMGNGMGHAHGAPSAN